MEGKKIGEDLRHEEVDPQPWLWESGFLMDWV